MIANVVRIDSLEAVYMKIDETCKRPMVAKSVIHLLGSLANDRREVGPRVELNGEDMSVREGLARLLRRRGYEPRSEKTLEIARQEVMDEIRRKGTVVTEEELEQRIEARADERHLKNSMRNLSATIADLDNAGLIERYYMGKRTSHPNNGGTRNAVYRLSRDAAAALNLSPSLRQMEAPLH